MLQLHLRLINFIWQPKLYYKHPNNGWIHCMTMWIVALGLASLRFDLRIDVKWLECVIIMYAKMCVCGWQNATNVTTIGLIQVNSVVVYVYSTRAWQNLIMKWLLRLLSWSCTMHPSEYVACVTGTNFLFLYCIYSLFDTYLVIWWPHTKHNI